MKYVWMFAAAAASALTVGMNHGYCQEPPGDEPTDEAAPSTIPIAPGASAGMDGWGRTAEPDPRVTVHSVGRSVTVTGMVAVEGGGPPPAAATVEAVCNGVVGQAVYTKGRFRISVGQAYSTDDRQGQLGNGQGLIGCEVRATLPGYLPSVVALDGLPTTGADVGVMALRRRGNAQGFTESATSYLAPKQARRAYEKGIDRVRRNKLEEAQREFESAVRIYPKYAAAWFELGIVYQKQQQVESARQAYERSIQSDSRFLKPGLQIAMLEATERNWPEVAAITERIITVNPVEFPQAYLYNAVANYNLRKPEAAERSARKAIELDPNGRLPKARHLMGVLLADRHDLAGAVEHLRAYLMRAPGAPDYEAVRSQLSAIEQQLTQTQTAQATGR